MTNFAKLITAFAVGCVATAAAIFMLLRFNASMSAWEIRNCVPTSDIATSKAYNVFVCAYVTPSETYEIGDTKIQIDSIWLEHSTDAIQERWCLVRQTILPELKLCVRTKEISRGSDSSWPEVTICVNGVSETFVPMAHRTICFDIEKTDVLEISIASGETQMGHSFISSRIGKVTQNNRPNQAPEPTSTAVTPPAVAGDRASGARGSS